MNCYPLGLLIGSAISKKDQSGNKCLPIKAGIDHELEPHKKVQV